MATRKSGDSSSDEEGGGGSSGSSFVGEGVSYTADRARDLRGGVERSETNALGGGDDGGGGGREASPGCSEVGAASDLRESLTTSSGRSDCWGDGDSSSGTSSTGDGRTLIGRTTGVTDTSSSLPVH